MSDRSVLIGMGFADSQVDIALKKSGGLQGALDLLTSGQELVADATSSAEAGATSINENDASAVNVEGEATATSKSLKCSECGRQLAGKETQYLQLIKVGYLLILSSSEPTAGAAQAQAHAEKTGHEAFEESTEEIKPLTGEDSDWAS